MKSRWGGILRRTNNPSAVMTDVVFVGLPLLA